MNGSMDNGSFAQLWLKSILAKVLFVSANLVVPACLDHCSALELIQIISYSPRAGWLQLILSGKLPLWKRSIRHLVYLLWKLINSTVWPVYPWKWGRGQGGGGKGGRGQGEREFSVGWTLIICFNSLGEGSLRLFVKTFNTWHSALVIVGCKPVANNLMSRPLLRLLYGDIGFVYPACL
jgi:hypothetical protein